MSMPRTIDGDWYPGEIPTNVELGDAAYIQTSFSFHRFDSQHPNALRLGRGAAAYQQTIFDTGPSARIDIGEFTMLNCIRIICDQSVNIGNHCLLAWNVIIMDTRRVPLNPAARATLLRQAIDNDFTWPKACVNASPVHIGDNVWIGFDSIVLPGVRIGTGSVIGARSVVAEDIPDYTVAVGNPARIVKQLTTPTDRLHA